MAKEKYEFTRKGDNLCGTLIHGLKVGDDVLKDFEMRPAHAGDMFDAEDLASPTKFMAYRGALLSRQITLLGNMNGPIDFNLIRALHPADFDMLTDAMDEVEVPGKDESSLSEAGTSESSSSE